MERPGREDSQVLNTDNETRIVKPDVTLSVFDGDVVVDRPGYSSLILCA
jgi:hypothetical protein